MVLQIIMYQLQTYNCKHIVTTLIVTGLLNLSTYKVIKLLDIYFEDLMDLVDLKNYYCYGFY